MYKLYCAQCTLIFLIVSCHFSIACTLSSLLLWFLSLIFILIYAIIGAVGGCNMRKESEDSKRLDETFRILNDRINYVYQFVMLYNSYVMSEHDYGTGHMVTMIEAHTLTYIEENPGTTVTELAKYWNKTKGALSQTVTRLVNKGLVSRHKTEQNAKTVLLYPTEDGRRLSQAHRLYNTIDISKTLNDLLKDCTMEEIDSFYKVLGSYIKLLKNDFE